MRFDFSFATMNLPDAFVDRTTYKFGNDNDEASLSVSWDNDSASRSGDQLLDARIDRITTAYQSQARFGEYAHVDVPIGKTVSAHGTAGQAYTHLAYVQIGSAFLFLLLVSSRSAMRHVLDRAMQTLAPCTAPGMPPHTAEARRGVGKVAMIVPHTFSLPLDFRFDHGNCVIDMSGDWTLGFQSPNPRELVYVADGEAVELVVDQAPYQLATPTATGLSGDWIVKHHSPATGEKPAVHVRQAVLHLGSRTVRVRGRSLASDAALLKNAVNTITSSVAGVALL